MLFIRQAAFPHTCQLCPTGLCGRFRACSVFVGQGGACTHALNSRKNNPMKTRWQK